LGNPIPASAPVTGRNLARLPNPEIDVVAGRHRREELSDLAAQPVRRAAYPFAPVMTPKSVAMCQCSSELVAHQDRNPGLIRPGVAV
jgi:hypothetical protein